MQEINSTHIVATPTWLVLFLLVAAGLVFLAFIAVITVLLAAGKPIIPVQRLKSIALVMALIVPALIVVGLIGVVGTSVRSVGSVKYHQDARTARAEQRRQAAVDSVTNRRGPGLERHVDARVVSLSPEAVEREVPVAASDAAQAVDGNSGMPAEVLTGILRVRGTASAPPEWEGKEPIPSADGVLVALSSQRFATIAEAEQQVTQMAVNYVKEFYRREYPLPGDWAVPVAMIERHAVDAIVGEAFEKDFGNGVTGKMYRAHLRLDLNPGLRQAIKDSWQEQIVTRRLWDLGGFLGLATLALATFAGYFRLDDFTGGQYRHRLKLAAASLIAAGSLVAWQVLA